MGEMTLRQDVYNVWQKTLPSHTKVGMRALYGVGNPVDTRVREYRQLRRNPCEDRESVKMFLG